MNDFFGPGSNTEKRIVRNLNKLKEIVTHLRGLGFKIVLTSGTFDLFHIGHCRYLEHAKSAAGDPDQTILIVGVDSNKKVQKRKGKKRPIIPQDERTEIVCHTRHADIVFIKELSLKKHELIKTVKPDVLVQSETTKETKVRKESEQNELKGYCGKIIILKPQATTTTSAKIRLLIIDLVSQIKRKFDEFSKDFYKFLERLGGDHE